MPAKLLIFVLAAAALGCMVIVLMGQYASGTVYGEYSSRSTDRLGTAAIYEALSKVNPNVSRNELPLSTLDEKNAEILILGLEPSTLASNSDYLNQLEALAKRGNRVVIGLDGGGWLFETQQAPGPAAPTWHLRIVDKRDKDVYSPRDTFQLEPAPGSQWKSVMPNAVTRDFDTGTILLIGTSWAFTNAALKENRDITELNRAIGRPSRVIFDETHLGTSEQGSVMGLVRRFRLQGVVAVALACALLFIWQSSSPYPPQRAGDTESDTHLAAATAGEGLRNLLAHHIPANRIVSVCVAEWRKDRGRLVSPDKLALIESIAARKAHPVSQWREIREALGLNKSLRKK